MGHQMKMSHQFNRIVENIYILYGKNVKYKYYNILWR
jgi:hypothetical protein